MFRLEKGKLRRELNDVFWYLKSGFIEVRDRFFSKVDRFFSKWKKGTIEEISADLTGKNTLL